MLCPKTVTACQPKYAMKRDRESFDAENDFTHSLHPLLKRSHSSRASDSGYSDSEDSSDTSKDSDNEPSVLSEELKKKVLLLERKVNEIKRVLDQVIRKQDLLRCATMARRASEIVADELINELVDVELINETDARPLRRQRTDTRNQAATLELFHKRLFTELRNGRACLDYLA